MSVKTMAIRLDPALHARISILARLTGVSVTDAIRVAIEKHVEVLAADPVVAEQASALRAQIARDADDQQAAIQALFGGKQAAAAPATPEAPSRRPRKA